MSKGTTSELETAIEVVRIRKLARSGKGQAFRERAGLSRADVAREVKVHQSTIGRWEEGTRAPRGDAALRYGRLLRRLGALS